MREVPKKTSIAFPSTSHDVLDENLSEGAQQMLSTALTRKWPSVSNRIADTGTIAPIARRSGAAIWARWMLANRWSTIDDPPESVQQLIQSAAKRGCLLNDSDLLSDVIAVV